jgi:hypothetical protein
MGLVKKTKQDSSLNHLQRFWLCVRDGCTADFFAIEKRLGFSTNLCAAFGEH